MPEGMKYEYGKGLSKVPPGESPPGAVPQEQTFKALQGGKL
jgi:hypothetical protein